MTVCSPTYIIHILLLQFLTTGKLYAVTVNRFAVIS